MMKVLVRNWWLLALRSVFAMLFALLAFSMRSFAGTYLLSAFVAANQVIVFGLLVFAAGISTMAAASWNSEKETSWLLFLDGLGIALAGAVTIAVPGFTFARFVNAMALGSVVLGGLEIALAFRIRRHLPDEWFLLIAGAATIGFGVRLLVVPAADMSAVLTWLGVYAAFSAICMMALALRLRKLRSEAHQLSVTM
ncbi:MAG TPA: DUF308 domain-containing protein [Candidatus Angelobacter sp.]|nr:DUF308 domain-containing protein [Candidatus Angelobacter sp.]